MTGFAHTGWKVAILSVAMSLCFSSPGMARGIINFETLRSQGMALRDEIRRLPCWKNAAEVEALAEREGLWQDHVEKLEKADPEIRHSGGGWRAERLATIWNEIVQALRDLRARPCATSGTPRGAVRNLPISNDDDWGDSHAGVAQRSPDPYPTRGGPGGAPYSWPGDAPHDLPGSGDYPRAGGGAYPPAGGGSYPAPYVP